MAEAPAPTRERGDTAHLARMAMTVLVLAAGFAFVPRLTQSCGKSSGTVREAPDFTASVIANSLDPAQKTMTLSAFRGHPVVLDFWATWCGPCQAEAPIVNAVAQRFKDQGLIVIGVNTSDEDGRRLAPIFAQRKGLAFPIVYDDGNGIAQRYNVDNLPTLVIVSKEGMVVAVRHGVTSDADLERLVRKVL